jgi:hypothetical protein
MHGKLATQRTARLAKHQSPEAEPEAEAETDPDSAQR